MAVGNAVCVGHAEPTSWQGTAPAGENLSPSQLSPLLRQVEFCLFCLLFETGFDVDLAVLELTM